MLAISDLLAQQLQDNPDVVLVYMPPFSFETPPLGLAYLSRYLRVKGRRTAVMDLNPLLFKLIPEHLKKYWFGDHVRLCHDADVHERIVAALEKPLSYYVDAICSSPAPIVGFTVLYINILLSAEMAKRIKERAPGKVVLFGGQECSWHFADRCIPKCYFGEGAGGRYPPELVDAFVVGEGEETLREIVERVRSGRELAHIPGAACRASDYRDYAPRPLIQNLDEIPYPTFEEFQLTDYTPYKLPMIMSRGCIGRCAFCNDHKIYNKFRHRSAAHVFREMAYHIEHYGVKDFFFCDLLVNGNIRELDKLCDLIIASGHALVWYGSARARREMTPELLSTMKRAGCTALTYGIESFSPRVMRLMNKDSDVGMIREVLRATHEAGIRTQVNVVVGFPGETESEFRQTTQFIKDNRQVIDAIGSVSTCAIINGADCMEHPERYGVCTRGEIDSSYWRSIDGSNTYVVRKRRAQELLSLARALDLPVVNVSLGGEEQRSGIADILARLRSVFSRG